MVTASERKARGNKSNLNPFFKHPCNAKHCVCREAAGMRRTSQPPQAWPKNPLYLKRGKSFSLFFCFICGDKHCLFWSFSWQRLPKAD